ncbi:M23 family metallopeptidase [Microbacterium resistens]|uniref:M23 family metallopeptidase n=1 Tax=Microbacterium resistens TaxID=156977 RepID=A0ABY3RRP3_9MICO|nr:M23 family metallopeptidase [Microbacterium resistens]UGS26586.1 M23 family metallopeptidase [Microbacterium resistens]
MLPIPFDNPSTYPGHAGVDFGQSRGTLIPASGPGVVSALTYAPKPGYVTWVRYDEYPDYEVGYCHQDSPDRPAIGTRVNEGDWLGWVGSTGTNSDGPHLHLETDPGGTYEAVWDLFTAARIVGRATTPTPPPNVPKEDPMSKYLELKRWNRLHFFLLGPETVYYVADPNALAYLKDHYGPFTEGDEMDNAAFTLELNLNAIPWSAVDACMRSVALGNDGRHWSRQQAEGIAIRGQLTARARTLDDERLTLDDLLTTAAEIPPVETPVTA